MKSFMIKKEMLHEFNLYDTINQNKSYKYGASKLDVVRDLIMRKV